MAILTTTISKSPTWTKGDVVLQLEEALGWLGWHGGEISGIVTGIVGLGTTGGNLGIAYTAHTNVFQTSTSGVGTGASFDIQRNSPLGQITQIRVNRPGVGYTDGEVVQISADSIGGTANGAVGIALTVKIAGNASPVGYGSTSTFFMKDTTPLYPYGIQRHTIQPNKKYGDVYRAFNVVTNTTMRLLTGPSFHPGGPNVLDTTSNLGMGYTMNFRGDHQLDHSDGQHLQLGNNGAIQERAQVKGDADRLGSNSLVPGFVYASSTSYKLDLNIFRSGIDPNFAVLSFRHPTLSTTSLQDNTFATFILHNFTTSLWNLDYVFLGGVTEIVGEVGNATIPALTFRTYLSSYSSTYGNPLKRMAEFGYLTVQTNNQISNATKAYIEQIYESNSALHASSNATRSISKIYYRSQALQGNRSRGGYENQNTVDSAANFNAVIKGIPLNGNLIPTPYYIPDDFVLIEFDYSVNSTNIQQGDTITISGSEVYTVITGSYNQTTRTRGILFCGRKV